MWFRQLFPTYQAKLPQHHPHSALAGTVLLPPIQIAGGATSDKAIGRSTWPLRFIECGAAVTL